MADVDYNLEMGDGVFPAMLELQRVVGEISKHGGRGLHTMQAHPDAPRLSLSLSLFFYLSLSLFSTCLSPSFSTCLSPSFLPRTVTTRLQAALNGNPI